MLISNHYLRLLRLLHNYWLWLNFLLLSELLKELSLQINLILLLPQLFFLLLYEHFLLISLVVKESFWGWRHGPDPGVGCVFCIKRAFGLL